MMRTTHLLLYVLLSACYTSARDAEVEAIANTILGEARGEGTQGMKLVADVIHSRVKSEVYPDSAIEVVRQRHQFYGSHYKCKNWQSTEAVLAVNLAKRLIKGDDPIPQSQYTHFWSGNALPSWAKGSKPYKFKNHKFIQIH